MWQEWFLEPFRFCPLPLQIRWGCRDQIKLSNSMMPILLLLPRYHRCDSSPPHAAVVPIRIKNDNTRTTATTIVFIWTPCPFPSLRKKRLPNSKPGPRWIKDCDGFCPIPRYRLELLMYPCGPLMPIFDFPMEVNHPYLISMEKVVPLAAPLFICQDCRPTQDTPIDEVSSIQSTVPVWSFWGRKHNPLVVGCCAI